MTIALIDSWTTAERECFDKLLTATESTEKKNAFLGYLPPAVNVWAFKIGGGGSVEENWGTQTTVMHMDADIEGLFEERARAQQFALKVMSVFPVWHTSNVQCLRPRTGGMPDIRGKYVPLANRDRGVFVWAVSIGLEIVFNTTETY